MILNWIAATTFVPVRVPSLRIACNAIGVDSEQLRAQLDQLHSEAEDARRKANNARLRLMRLSEAAEKLQKQAKINVQSGNENDARNLLYQKKKVLQALEKSKSRIELLDDLSAKLNEAISVKESQLIDNVGLDLEVARKDVVSGPIWVVSPKEEATDNVEESEKAGQNPLKCKDPELDAHAQSQSGLAADDCPNYIEDSLFGNTWKETDMANQVKGISSYESFLQHLDQNLNKIEAEVVAVLKFSNMILEGEEQPTNSKVQQLVQILVDIRHARGRIQSIMETKVDIR